MNYSLWDKVSPINKIPAYHFLSQIPFRDYDGDIILIYDDKGRVTNIECKNILAKVYGIDAKLPLDEFMAAYFELIKRLNEDEDRV